MYKVKRFGKTSDDAKRTGKEAVGAGLVIGGGSLIKNSNKSGELTGRVDLYHSADRRNINKILNEGLDGSHSKNPDNLTNKVTKGSGIRDSRSLIYLSKDKELATDTAAARYQHTGSKSKTLKVSIPYDELKRIKTEGNPELGNAKTYKEYLSITGKSDSPQLRDKWNKLSGDKTSRTVLVEGSIPSKYIKGSKTYKKNSIGEIASYIKNNPKRFLKGSSKVIGGTALTSVGIKAISKANESYDKDSSNSIESLASLGSSAYAGKLVYDKSYKNLLNEAKSKYNPVIEKLDAESSRNNKAEIMNKLRSKNPGKYKPGGMELIYDSEAEVKRLNDSSNKAKGKVMKLLDKSKKSAKLNALAKACLVSGGLASGYLVASSLRDKRSKIKNE